MQLSQTSTHWTAQHCSSEKISQLNSVLMFSIGSGEFKDKTERKSKNLVKTKNTSTSAGKPAANEPIKKITMGSHWEQTGYPLAYQLSRRVEDVAVELSIRQKGGWQPLKKHVEELYEISAILKGLELRKKR